jgi:hypothetical protein
METRLVNTITPRWRGHKSASTLSLNVQSFLVCAVFRVCRRCWFSDPCALVSIGLLMVRVSTVLVALSRFAEEGFYSQQQQHLGFVLPVQVEELLFDLCPGKTYYAFCRRMNVSSNRSWPLSFGSVLIPQATGTATLNKLRMIKKTLWSESARELYRQNDRRLSTKLVSTFCW